MTVYFTPEQDAALRDVSQRTGITMAALIREGVQRALDAYGEDKRTVFARAERMADGDDPDPLALAAELRRLVNHARQLQEERDKAEHRAFRSRGHLQELEKRIAEMVSTR
jgi:hypothetical protein